MAFLAIDKIVLYLVLIIKICNYTCQDTCLYGGVCYGCKKVNVIVVGSGLAALLTAKYLCKHCNVLLFTKSSSNDNNSFYAQGGVACALAKTDSWQEHYSDTLIAGCDHNDKEAVRFMTERGPQLLQELINEGMQFDMTAQGELSFGMEGAHSSRRIIHAGGDQTGKLIMEWLQRSLQGQLEIMTHETVTHIISQAGICQGVQIINSITGRRQQYAAAAVVLATGGAGALYPSTSNHKSITGMALSLAYNAGASLVDLEFMQFHPTMLLKDGKGVGLISEAVRGEGAYLQNCKNERFMAGIHELGDLAPRDIVARAIYNEIQQGRKVYLNISPINDFVKRFPSISKLCIRHGIALESKLLPVLPGAHFYMGGIKTNINGETTLPGLYAVGEAACNGVHGANRLASNSLLETIVFSRCLADNLLAKKYIKSTINNIKDFDNIIDENFNYEVNLPSKDKIQAMMMQHVGITRNKNNLEKIYAWLAEYKMLWRHIDNPAVDFSLSDIEIIHMLQLCYLITKSALARKESRGAHYRDDFRVPLEKWQQRRIEHNICSS